MSEDKAQPQGGADSQAQTQPQAQTQTQAVDRFGERIKGLAALLAALAAFATSIAAFVKPPDPTPAKNTYEELAKAIKEISAQNARTHDDVVALRSYLEAYVRFAGVAAPDKGVSVPVAQNIPPPDAVGSIGSGQRPRQPPKTGKAEEAATKERASELKMAPLPPIPAVGPTPSVWQGRSAEDVVRGAPKEATPRPAPPT